MRLGTLLARSDAMHAALSEAVGTLEVPMVVRATVTMDALMVAEQHGQALRHLLALDLGVSAMGLLRLHYEAVLRAVWALYAASESDLLALAAPLTPGTAKAAKSLGMPGELLDAIDKSAAPPDLKRSLREIRTSSWDIMNSYVHAGIHPLRRHESSHEHELTTGAARVQRPRSYQLRTIGYRGPAAKTPRGHQHRLRRLSGVHAPATCSSVNPGDAKGRQHVDHVPHKEAGRRRRRKFLEPSTLLGPVPTVEEVGTGFRLMRA